MAPTALRIRVTGRPTPLFSKLREYLTKSLSAQWTKFLLCGVTVSGSLTCCVAVDPTEVGTLALANRSSGNGPSDDDFREGYCRAVRVTAA
jgi:hypothetical protein